jgi:DASH complex subunit Dam1
MASIIVGFRFVPVDHCYSACEASLELLINPLLHFLQATALRLERDSQVKYCCTLRQLAHHCAIMSTDGPTSHEKRSASRSRTSRPTTPLRPSSRSEFRESVRNATFRNDEFPLNSFEPSFAELSDAMIDLEANMMHFQLMHESLARFSESFASFLYGLNMNAFCVDFPEVRLITHAHTSDSGSYSAIGAGGGVLPTRKERHGGPIIQPPGSRGRSDVPVSHTAVKFTRA